MAVVVYALVGIALLGAVAGIWLERGPLPGVRSWRPRPLVVQDTLYTLTLAPHWRERESPADDRRLFVTEDDALALVVVTVVFEHWPPDTQAAVDLLLETAPRQGEEVRVERRPWDHLVERWLPEPGDEAANAAAELAMFPGIVSLYIGGEADRAVLEAARAEVLAGLKPVRTPNR